ncbi:unnamed protein product [Ilex paraguariensis]|uniref:Uncharacterized protein n=1 Tax=Ilex paraguariensis TaxID=185542 RepID=A0ABC8R6R4_9AQUA
MSNFDLSHVFLFVPHANLSLCLSLISALISSPFLSISLLSSPGSTSSLSPPSPSTHSIPPVHATSHHASSEPCPAAIQPQTRTHKHSPVVLIMGLSSKSKPAMFYHSRPSATLRDHRYVPLPCSFPLSLAYISVSPSISDLHLPRLNPKQIEPKTHTHLRTTHTHTSLCTTPNPYTHPHGHAWCSIKSI